VNRVHNDQTGVRQMAADLSAKLTIHRSLPGQRAEASAKHAEGLTSLAKLTGLASDKASLQHELAFHSAAETPVPVAYSTDLRARMGHVLPGFEHHLASTKRVAKTLGYR